MKVVWIAALLCSIMNTNVVLAAPILGDRLVVSINNQPYSQRQVESYFYVKESLREDAPAFVVNEQNWASLVSNFVGDMIVLQEAIRLGSFQPNEAAINKFSSEIEARLQSHSDLKNSYSRLGIDGSTLRYTLSKVLRVAGFRRSKTRLNESRDSRLEQRWFDELQKRAVTRSFDRAFEYRTIQPKQRTAVDDAL